MEYPWKTLVEKSEGLTAVLNNGTLVRLNLCVNWNGWNYILGSEYGDVEEKVWSGKGLYCGYMSGKKIRLQLDPDLNLHAAINDITDILNLVSNPWTYQDKAP